MGEKEERGDNSKKRWLGNKESYRLEKHVVELHRVNRSSNGNHEETVYNLKQRKDKEVVFNSSFYSLVW